MVFLCRRALVLLTCSLTFLLAGRAVSGAPQTGEPDTEAIPTISINSVSQEEGNVGTTDFIFTVSLSETSGDTVTVDFATRDGQAVAGTDYYATSGTVTFAPGVQEQPVTVQVSST